MTAKQEATVVETEVEISVQEFITILADDYGVDIFGATYFDGEDHAQRTADLSTLYDVVKGLVREHDKLADETGNKRILGKRGRKAEAETVPTSAADVLKRLYRK